ncbi:hypothetical protein [Microbacterium oxydans]|uniref:hypothetical protein n=1 Tax=Microbacterium oxydans TaxID=82380 RepID=UPI0024AE14F9|nr:hypothetical protein [Microbacterium oxydans]
MSGGDMMRVEEREELAAAIESTLRSTPGVRSIYRSGSLISQLLRVGAEAIGARKDDEPMVSVIVADGGVVIEATLGVESTARSGDILHGGHGAVDALLDARGVRRESITLTVAHVQPAERPQVCAAS